MLTLPVHSSKNASRLFLGPLLACGPHTVSVSRDQKQHLQTCDSSLKLRLLQFSLAVCSREHERRKISNSCVSLNDEAILRCLVSDRFASASEIWFISQVRCDKSCTPIMQCSTDPYVFKPTIELLCFKSNETSTNF